jgi:hypothetical protein
VTDVVLLDGQANPLQTRPWVHVEALARHLRWHSPHSAALMMWFAHGTDDGWCVTARVCRRRSRSLCFDPARSTPHRARFTL